jgi:hypothetical protein
MPPKPKRSLENVVGKEAYSVWVNMLRELVPDGRTHRLSVIIAGMLQYAFAIAEGRDEDKLDEDSVASSLRNAGDMSPDEVKEELHDVVKRLFSDAGVMFDRMSKRGDPYSIADEAYEEFARWFDYPWE